MHWARGRDLQRGYARMLGKVAPKLSQPHHTSVPVEGLRRQRLLPSQRSSALQPSRIDPYSYTIGPNTCAICGELIFDASKRPTCERCRTNSSPFDDQPMWMEVAPPLVIQQTPLKGKLLEIRMAVAKEKEERQFRKYVADLSNGYADATIKDVELAERRVINDGELDNDERSELLQRLFKARKVQKYHPKKEKKVTKRQPDQQLGAALREALKDAGRPKEWWQ